MPENSGCKSEEPMRLKKTVNKSPEIIELSDDDDDNEDPAEQRLYGYRVLTRKWFYFDPKGTVQGPVTVSELLLWNKEDYFDPDFKVWEDGKTSLQAILLTDMLSALSDKDKIWAEKFWPK